MRVLIETCFWAHEFAFYSIVLNCDMNRVLAMGRRVNATALKPTHEAGRRGGDSIARRHVFNYQN